MNRECVLKIKDSVDLFLSNERYLMVYYMNSRQKKSFRINEEMIHLLENIDGEKTVAELLRLMEQDDHVEPDCTRQVIKLLLDQRIISEKVTEQNILPEALVSRYSRQINYFSEFLENELEGIKAQKRIMDSTVLIFG